MMILEIKGVSKYFGGLPALRDVSFEVNQGEIVGVIGPNGAGKTTLLNCISGIFPLSAGTISLDGSQINHLKPHRICRAGIGRTFQIPRPFGRMSTLENVIVAHQSVTESPEHYLEIVGLSDKTRLPANRLTFHERRRLELARALSTEPRILLLDEIMAGLNPSETIQMVSLLRSIHEGTGLTILWIEHVMRAIMESADWLVVLHQGRRLLKGVPREIAHHPKVVEIYLGEKYQFKGDSVAQG
ncbi:MAG: ABC transporter ATP-binding protein [Thermodesulfobacteriota bacterium]